MFDGRWHTKEKPKAANGSWRMAFGHKRFGGGVWSRCTRCVFNKVGCFFQILPLCRRICWKTYGTFWRAPPYTPKTVRCTCLSTEQVYVVNMSVNSSKSKVQRDINYLCCPFSGLGSGSAWGRTALWPSCCENFLSIAEHLLLNQPWRSCRKSFPVQADWCDTSQFNLLTTWLPRPHKPPETLKRRLRFNSTT